MFTPIYDLVKYTKIISKNIWAKDLHYPYFGLFAAISEGIGILMLLPLLESF